jgi:hypothetical protein
MRRPMFPVAPIIPMFMCYYFWLHHDKRGSVFELGIFD